MRWGRRGEARGRAVNRVSWCTWGASRGLRAGRRGELCALTAELGPHSPRRGGEPGREYGRDPDRAAPWRAARDTLVRVTKPIGATHSSETINAA